MKIAYYCQHVLGVGHLHRSLTICREMAREDQVVMITGGAPHDLGEADISFQQLPGLVMDRDFKNLAPVNSSFSLAETKEKRVKKLDSFLSSFRPDVFLVELYPFGRKSFRFELDPILKDIRRGRFGDCLAFSSVRDILVERHDREKFEKRVVTTLNTLFDGVLIHGEEKFIPLQRSFSLLDEVSIPRAYTGYVAPGISLADRFYFRDEMGIAPATDLIVASIGGGSVGGELLHGVVESMKLLDEDYIKLQIFTGPYASDSLFADLSANSDERITVARFSNDFHRWLAAADVSVSMAGYNTTMNVLAAGCPALFYPFQQNQEQQMRIDELAKIVPIKILGKADLQPEVMAKHLLDQLGLIRFHSPIPLDGAARTANQVRKWCKELRASSPHCRLR